MWYGCGMRNPADADTPFPSRANLRAQTLAGAAALGMVLVAGLAMWGVYGEGLYAERLLAMIASCI